MMHSKQFFVGIFLFSILFISSFDKCFAEIRKEVVKDSKMILRLHQRVLAVARNAISLQENLIFRIKAGRPIDRERLDAQFQSARRQIIQLRKLAEYLEKHISPADTNFPAIQGLKSRLGYIIEQHRKNVNELKSIADSEILNSIKAVEESCGKLEKIDETRDSYVRSIDEQM